VKVILCNTAIICNTSVTHTVARRHTSTCSVLVLVWTQALVIDMLTQLAAPSDPIFVSKFCNSTHYVLSP